jgi:hypothetical protein
MSLAGLADIDWISPALSAVDCGHELPTPFDDFGRVWDVLFADQRIPGTTVTSLDGTTPNMSQQAMAVPALFGAVEPDPLQAALDALYAAAAAFGSDYPALLDEVRRAFPMLSEPSSSR